MKREPLCGFGQKLELIMQFLIRLLFCVLLAGAPLAAQDYRLKTQIQVGGDGAWDFIELDSAGRRFYLPHGNTVAIIDTDKNAVVGEIEERDRHCGGLLFAMGMIAENGGRIAIDRGDPCVTGAIVEA